MKCMSCGLPLGLWKKKHPGTGKRKAQHDPTVGKREEKNSWAEPSPALNPDPSQTELLQTVRSYGLFTIYPKNPEISDGM